MTKKIYSLYLASCLHLVKARPRREWVWCPECRAAKEAAELTE